MAQGRPGSKTATSVVCGVCLECGDEREIGILLPNDQRQHRTWHRQKDELPYALCASCQAPGWPRRSCAASVRKVDIRLHGQGNSNSHGARRQAPRWPRPSCAASGRKVEREFFIDNLMVRIHLTIVMILVDPRWPRPSCAASVRKADIRPRVPGGS